MSRVDWGFVLDRVDEALEAFRSQGVKPTLRTLFYWLVSKQVIPNTRNAYSRLSEKLVEARKMGRWGWDILEDRTRVVLGELSDYKFNDHDMALFEQKLSRKLESLDIDKMLSDTFDYLEPLFMVGRWAEQPVVCEIWIEKEALASTIQSWTQDLGIPIRVNRGYSSWTFIYNNTCSLGRTLTSHQKVVILYLGDLDPSGVDIQRFLEEAIRYFGLGEDRVEFTRLAITADQVEEFNLPPRPEDAETLAKLARDTRSRKYGFNYIVELDALVAYAPDEFRRIIRDAVLSRWDKSVYERLEDQARKLQEEADRRLREVKEEAKKKIIEMIMGGKA
jgi:hypothetical protein